MKQQFVEHPRDTLFEKPSFFIGLFIYRFNFSCVSVYFHMCFFLSSFSFILQTNRCLCFCFFLGPRVALVLPSWVGGSRARGWPPSRMWPDPTVRGNEKEKGNGSAGKQHHSREEPHLREKGLGLAFLLESGWPSFSVLACPCFLGSGLAFLPWSWVCPGFLLPSWSWVAIASPFLGVRLIFLLGVGVGVVNIPSWVQSSPRRNEKQGQPKTSKKKGQPAGTTQQKRGRKTAPPKGGKRRKHHTKRRRPPKEGRGQATPPREGGGAKQSHKRRAKKATPSKGEGKAATPPKDGGGPVAWRIGVQWCNLSPDA